MHAAALRVSTQTRWDVCSSLPLSAVHVHDVRQPRIPWVQVEGRRAEWLLDARLIRHAWCCAPARTAVRTVTGRIFDGI